MVAEIERKQEAIFDHVREVVHGFSVQPKEIALDGEKTASGLVGP
jgi:hypothetical protein